MQTILDILRRELAVGTFDETCSEEEREKLEGFVKHQTVIFLGTANGWGETPEIVSECLEKKHTLRQEGIGRCLTKVSCDICHYEYLIDSSD